MSRLGLVVASLATAGTFAVALIGLGGPPAVADTTVALADTTTADAPVPQVVVRTIYVQLAAPTAAPVAAAPKAVSAVVTSQSGPRGTEGGEQEGDD